jgi:hypothetical protein
MGSPAENQKRPAHSGETTRCLSATVLRDFRLTGM